MMLHQKPISQNPYTVRPLAQSYSSTSDILNVDTASLSAQARGDFHGFVASGMVLKGQSSGAQATLNNVRLVSDLSATLIGSYYIPNPNSMFKFETGTEKYLLWLMTEYNNQDLATTVAEESFTSAGTLETVQENIISIRNARVELKNEFESLNVSRELGTETLNTRLIGSQTRTQTTIAWYDPLAQQSFLIKKMETGVFMTSCDVFFRSKDDMDIPVVFN